MSLSGKVAVVTGVTSGLGRVIAAQWARQGAVVVGAGRRADPGTQLERELRSAGHEMVFVRADVARCSDCRLLMDETLTRFGRIDVLVNNAGTLGSPALVETHELEEEYWDNVVDTNLKGALFCARYALGAMRAQGAGVILNVSSLTAVMPTARALSYSVSKSALLALTRQLALEYVDEGIRCNAVILGHVPTEMSNTVVDEMARIMRGTDFRRTQSGGLSNTAMSAEAVAGLMALLCSDEFQLVTGAAIPVDRALSTGLMASRLRYLHSAEMITPL